MSGASTGTDITISWNPAAGAGDWTMTGADLTTGQPLETAVLLSLFTDAVKTSDYVLNDGSTDARGWWADSFNGYSLGSNLWQLYRRKKTSQTGLLLEAQGYANAALAWLVDEGIAASVSTSCRWLTPTAMLIRIVITEPDGTLSNFAYAWAWQGLADATPAPMPKRPPVTASAFTLDRSALDGPDVLAIE